MRNPNPTGWCQRRPDREPGLSSSSGGNELPDSTVSGGHLGSLALYLCPEIISAPTPGSPHEGDVKGGLTERQHFSPLLSGKEAKHP